MIIINLTNSGWTEAGFPNTRQLKPRPERVAHHLAPKALKQYIQHKTPVINDWIISGFGLTPTAMPVFDTRVYTPSQMKEWRGSGTAAAWGAIQDPGSGASSNNPTIGEFTQEEHLPRPDLIYLEEWQSANKIPEQCWNTQHDGAGDSGGEEWAHTIRVGVEVETTAKNTADLAKKINRLNTAVELGILNKIVWIIDNQKDAERLRRFGVGTSMYPAHYYADTFMTGIDQHAATGFLQAGSYPIWWLPALYPQWQRQQATAT